MNLQRVSSHDDSRIRRAGWCRSCRRWSSRTVWEGELIKHHVTQCEHPTCRRIITAVAAVIRRVAKEDALCGTGREFVGCGSSEVGVAGTAKYTEQHVIRWCAEKKVMWGERACAGAWSSVEEICHGGERLCPEHSRDTRVKEQRAHTIIESAKDVLSFPILLGCVGAGEAQRDAVRSKERTQSVVVELPAIISLKSNYWSLKLRANI